MANMSAIVYIIVGFSVGALAFLVNIVRGDNSFTFFIVIGFIILFWGLFQLYKQKGNAKKIQDKHLRGNNHKNLQKNHLQSHNNHHTNMHVQHIKNSPLPDIYCPKCGNTMKSYDNFCSNCGFRIR